MRICVNGTSVATGGGLVNLRGLLHALGELDTTNDYLVLVPEALDVPIAPSVPSMTVRPIPRHPGGAVTRIAWEQTALPGLIEREGVDLLFSPANVAPLRLPARCRSVVKVQNVAPFDPAGIALERGLRRKARLRALRRLTAASLRRADAAIFISAASRDRIRPRAERSEVIYDGLTPVPAPPAERRSILCVADMYPHKNLEVLVRGFALLPNHLREAHDLVFVGKPIVASYAEELSALVSSLGLGERVHLAAGVAHADLGAFYAGAAIYCLPSRIEAGGTTLVEAMAAGAPVVASDLAFAREFCGDAAVYADPLRPGAWASAIARLLTEPERVRTLVEAGQRRAGDFTWHACARQTLSLFESVGK